MKNYEGFQGDEIAKAVERLNESRRASEPPETLIWSALGLVLVLFYAFLLTTRWFS